MANALESASLVMIPSGYEDGTLGSLKPTDGSGDFTFTRGSNLSATRINEQGYIEKGYENLLLQSNQFDTTWQSVRVSESTGFAGYDGTNDAWKIVPNTQLGDHRLDQSTSVSGVWTFSIYAKAAGYDFLYILFSGIGNSGKVIDISPNQGVVVDSKGGVQAIDESITDVGNDWWKITLTYSGTLGTLRIITLPANDTSTYAGDGVSGILIQDAMLNQGLVAYPYIETTTAPVAGGILEDMPRLDWSGSCPSLLLEPQRTNIVPNSEYFGDTSTYNLASVSLTNIQSPDGYSPVYKITAASTNTSHLLRSVRPNVLENSTNTISAFFKSAEQSKAGLLFGGGSLGLPSIDYRLGKFDLTGAGSIIQTPINGSADIQSIGNGWYRCSISVTTLAAGGVWHDSVILNDNGDIDYTGDNTSGIYVWGTQFEQDATYPTSYIPTYGVSQTRLEDFFDSNADFTNFFGDNQGTIYIETDKRLFENLSSNEEFIGFRDGTKNWRIIGSQSIIFIQCSNWGSTIIHYPSTTNPTKYLFKWDGSNVSFYIDGSLIGSATQTATFNPNQFGRTGNGVSMDSQELLNQFTLFPTALSDSECIALTTI